MHSAKTKRALAARILWCDNVTRVPDAVPAVRQKMLPMVRCLVGDANAIVILQDDHTSLAVVTPTKSTPSSQAHPSPTREAKPIGPFALLCVPFTFI
jgi:hypothetical protein